MEAFTEFFEQDGALLFRVECYVGNAMHYAEYKTDSVAVKALVGEDAIKTLTKRFSADNTFLDYLKENGIGYTLLTKGYADTSSDV